MTLGGTQPMKFGKLFGLFSLYWNYCCQRGRRLNSLEVSLLTNTIYVKLREEWQKNMWDIEELDWACVALDNNYELLDPKNFLKYEFAYLDHVKICFYLDNTN